MRGILILLAGILALALAGAPRAMVLPPGTPLEQAILDPMLAAALESEAPAGPFEVVVDQPRLPLGNPSRRPTDLVLQGVEVDRDRGRFAGVLVGLSEGKTRFRLPLTGRLVRLVELPVATHPIARGHTLTAADLDWRRFDAGRIRPGTLEVPGQLIGTVTRRPLQAGRAIASRDVERPRLVERGRAVRLVYAGPGLRLETLGIAQESGTLGEVVRVVNADSERALSGVVAGPGEVRIGGGTGGVAR
jgi:flagella basal body P-ring formation protein FlgA